MIFFKHPPEDLELVGDFDLDKPYNEIIRRCLRLKGAVAVTDQQRHTLAPLVIEGLILEVEGKLLPAMLVPLFEMTEARVAAGRKGGKSHKSLKCEANAKQNESKPEASQKQMPSKPEAEEKRKEKTREEETREQQPQTPSPKSAQSVGYSPDFERFWSAYPRREGKGEAWKAWQKRKAPVPAIEGILAAITKAQSSAQWIKDGGQFIPHPSTWINQRRWEDEVKAGSVQYGSLPDTHAANSGFHADGTPFDYESRKEFKL